MNTRTTQTTKKTIDQPNTAGWVIGLVCIAVAIFFSGLLALKQLGVVGDSLPGCGPASACGALTSGPFGRIPGLEWPVSFVGLAWFIALAATWSMSRAGVSSTLRWLVRVGALASVGFILIMVDKGTICPYCLLAHLGNLGFWVVIEQARTSSRPSSGVMGGVGAFLVTTIVLAGGQMIHNAQTQEAAIENEEQFIDSVLAQEQPDPVVVDTSVPTNVVDSPAAVVRDLLASRWTDGGADAPVQVVMISDYQCPDCRTYELEIQSVLAKRDDVSLSVKHFPMCADCNPNVSRTMHANACWAARAAETAGILGGEQAFWEMHQWLFQNKGKFPGGQLPLLVDDLGFDRQEFTQIMASDETLDLVHQDIEDAIALGLFYTPMIFINGVELKWHMLPARLSQTVNSVADGIASGRAKAKQITPPVGIDKYVADWRDGRVRMIRPSNRDFRRRDRMDKAPQITAFVDFTSPNSAVFMHDLKEWEDTHGETDLILRINPLSHDCNPNLPKRMNSREGSCMSARALKAAGLIGGDETHFKMAWWLIENGYKLDEISETEIVDQAVVLGMDGAQFAQSMNSLGVEDLVEQDVVEFKKHQFPHMPAVLLEGRQIPRLTLDGYSVIGSALDEVAQQASGD